MAATKPQIRSMFATPVCVHYLPVAQETNAELRPLIAERAQSNGISSARGQGWRSPADFEEWGSHHAETLFRVLRDLSDNLTALRTGARTAVEWKITAAATMRQKGDYLEPTARAASFWSGVYYVDDGYAKSDDETLGGECELADPRGILPAMIAPQLAFRFPGGLTSGQTEIIRPQSGMIILHPSWLPRGERRHDGAAQRITIEFDLAIP